MTRDKSYGESKIKAENISIPSITTNHGNNHIILIYVRIDCISNQYLIIEEMIYFLCYTVMMHSIKL